MRVQNWSLLKVVPEPPPGSLSLCCNRYRATWLRSVWTVLSRLLSILIWLIGLGAIVLMWRGESTEYYSAVRGPR